MITTKTVTQKGVNSSQQPHQTIAPRETSDDQLGNWQLATKCHCCLHYNTIMNSNQIVYHNKNNMYNAYNVYMYNIMIGIEQLNAFSCANKQEAMWLMAQLKEYISAVL